MLGSAPALRQRRAFPKSFELAAGSMSVPAVRLAARAVMHDDGDSLNFCSTCAFSSACMAEGLPKSKLQDLHVLVEHIGLILAKPRYSPGITVPMSAWRHSWSHSPDAMRRVAIRRIIFN